MCVCNVIQLYTHTHIYIIIKSVYIYIYLKDDKIFKIDQNYITFTVFICQIMTDLINKKRLL